MGGRKGSGFISSHYGKLWFSHLIKEKGGQIFIIESYIF